MASTEPPQYTEAGVVEGKEKSARVGEFDDHHLNGSDRADAIQDEGAIKIKYDDSRKLGVTGAVFLILNKMIGTGSMPNHDYRN